MMDNAKILYVEDEEMYQTLVSQILTEQGFTVEVAGTGAEARQKLEEFRPNLMILDINLPDTDGYALCQELRQGEMWVKLPILMLTVRRQPEEWRQGFSVGASDYVSKPLNGPDLVERVRSCLAKKLVRAEESKNPEVLMAQAARGGNRGAFDVFVRQYKDPLVHEMQGHSRNSAEADDVVSETFLAAFEQLDDFRGQSSFFTWIYSIAKFKMHHQWRQRPMIPLTELRDKDEAAIVRSAEARNPSAADLSPSDQVALLRRLIFEIPEPYHTMLRWHIVHGLPYAEIARRLALPMATVKSRFFKARFLLRDAWRAVHNRPNA
jgi:RNA polymerase sigma factor (sigma-70 family)